MELYMCYQNVSEISRVMWFITTEILYLRQNVKTYSRDKRKEKHQTFSAPPGTRRQAFYQAFQLSLNYSRQWRRKRTLSAIILHSFLPSVSNINVIAFIFSGRLGTREVSLNPVHLFLTVSQIMTFEEKKTTMCCGDFCFEWAFIGTV